MRAKVCRIESSDNDFDSRKCCVQLIGKAVLDMVSNKDSAAIER